MSRGAAAGPSSQADPGAQSVAFRDFLVKLSSEITEEDLKNMKFRLQGQPDIGSADIEKCTETTLLFDLLEKRGFLSVKDTVILQPLCKGNVKLQEILNTYERSEDSDTIGPFHKIQTKLREGYADRLSESQTFTWCPWRKIRVGSLYTDLLVIPGKKHQLAVTTGEQFNCAEGVVDFLWKDPSHKVAFVQGGPGIGKSTFCRRMFHLWAVNKLMIPEREFDLVILLEGRNFSGDLKHCISQQLFPRDFLDEDTMYNCVHKYASNCLLIIDGVDELSGQGKMTALDLARGKLLHGVTLLLAGRPEATKDFMQYVNRHLEVQGFTYGNAVSYIHKYFGSRHTEKKNKLLRKIYYDRHVRGLTANPFTTLQLCLIAETGDGEMPSKTDEIMKQVIALTCKRYVSNLLDRNVTVDELIQAAELVAYFGMKMGSFVLDEEELQKVLVEKRIRKHLLKSGILSRDFTLARLDIRRTCWFPHKLIQDVLCVSYLAALSPDDLKRELDNPACVRGLAHNRYLSGNLVRTIVDDEPRFRVMLAYIIKDRNWSSFHQAVMTVTNNNVKNVLGEAIVKDTPLYCALQMVFGSQRDFRLSLTDIFQKMALPPVLQFSPYTNVYLSHNETQTRRLPQTYSCTLKLPTFMVDYPAQQNKNSIIPWGILDLNNQSYVPLHIRTVCIVWIPTIRDKFGYDPLPGLRDWLSKSTDITLFLVVPRRYHDDYFHLRALDFVKSVQFEHVTVKLCCNRTFHPSEQFIICGENVAITGCEFKKTLHQIYYDKFSPY